LIAGRRLKKAGGQGSFGSSGFENLIVDWVRKDIIRGR
jgi:hypothetical protein